MRKIAVVAICFPAVSNLTQCRIRICLSAGHTREMLDEVRWNLCLRINTHVHSLGHLDSFSSPESVVLLVSSNNTDS